MVFFAILKLRHTMKFVWRWKVIDYFQIQNFLIFQNYLWLLVEKITPLGKNLRFNIYFEIQVLQKQLPSSQHRLIFDGFNEHQGGMRPLLWMSPCNLSIWFFSNISKYIWTFYVWNIFKNTNSRFITIRIINKKWSTHYWGF